MKIFTLRQEVTEELRNHCAVGEKDFWKIVHTNIMKTLADQIQEKFPITWKKNSMGREYKIEFAAFTTEDLKKLVRLVWRLPQTETTREILTLLNK